MSVSPRVIYAGTPEFALPALQALVGASIDVQAVYTQPDRPAGRGKTLTASPVKQWALQQGLNVEQPESLKTDTVQQQLMRYKPDLMVVAAYGQILPPTVLALPRLGCINLHASLLPRWRGAAPIQRAISAGDTETGITLMQMDRGLDTGAMLAKRVLPIGNDQTASDLHDSLALLGADLLLESLPGILSGSLVAEPQDSSLACYAEKIKKTEAWLDWSQDAKSLAAKVQAFNAWPVAQTCWNDGVLRIWQAKVLSDGDSGIEKAATVTPGTVLTADKTGIYVACGVGILNILQLQQPGGRPLMAADFINAHPVSGQFRDKK